MQCPECPKGLGLRVRILDVRHYLARLHRKTLCYSKSKEMLEHSIRLLLHYLRFWDVPVPYIKQYSPF